MANCIKLKLLGHDERDVLLTHMQQGNITAATSTTAIAINTITSNMNTTTLTDITTIPKGMKVTFSRNFEGEMPTESHHAVCRLSKGCNSNILEKVWCMKLKLTRLVVRDVERTKRKYQHFNPTASTHATTTDTVITTTIATNTTKAYTTTINSIATTAATVMKTKDIKVKNLGYIETIGN